MWYSWQHNFKHIMQRRKTGALAHLCICMQCFFQLLICIEHMVLTRAWSMDMCVFFAWAHSAFQSVVFQLAAPCGFHMPKLQWLSQPCRMHARPWSLQLGRHAGSNMVLHANHDMHVSPLSISSASWLLPWTKSSTKPSPRSRMTSMASQYAHTKNLKEAMQLAGSP